MREPSFTYFILSFMSLRGSSSVFAIFGSSVKELVDVEVPLNWWIESSKRSMGSEKNIYTFAKPFMLEHGDTKLSECLNTVLNEGEALKS